MSRPDPVEIVAILVPLLIEATAVILFISALVIWTGVIAGRI